MAIELLSPAGNYDKLRAAFSYGADAAYMGMTEFSLRRNAGNFSEEEIEKVRALKEKTGKRLYCTMNILFHQRDIEKIQTMADEIRKWPFDAFIISDIGLVPFLKNNFPERELHLSTQASSMNSESVKMYRDMGFKRVILGREASLDDIKRIKDAVPEMELEAFVHGAMCMAYSGRCLLSAHLAGRSGNPALPDPSELLQRPVSQSGIRSHEREKTGKKTGVLPISAGFLQRAGIGTARRSPDAELLRFETGRVQRHMARALHADR